MKHNNPTTRSGTLPMKQKHTNIHHGMFPTKPNQPNIRSGASHMTINQPTVKSGASATVNNRNTTKHGILSHFTSPIKVQKVQNCPLYPKYSEFLVDKNSGKSVLHVRHFSDLMQAIGYVQYTAAGSGTNQRIYYRGQEFLYPTDLTASLYRGTTDPRTADQMMLAKVSACQSCSPNLKKMRAIIVEALFQQYGEQTQWLDLVDNVWVALWFACHHAWTAEQCIHYERRNPRMECSMSPYAYILLIGDEFSDNQTTIGIAPPTMYSGKQSELVDLRYAVPSTYIRPHAQHGLMIRKKHSINSKDRSLESLLKGVIRMDLADALDWLGHSIPLSPFGMVPPPMFDSGYGELLKLELRMKQNGGTACPNFQIVTT